MAGLLDKNTKRAAIVKANARVVGAVAAASFITVFCLIASKAVLSQNQYQARVITEKSKANNQIKKNIENFETLVISYKKFDSKDPNAINGAKNGSGDNDGSNSKLTLDSLPSTYDFPALTSTLEKILKDRNLNTGGISGTDDQTNQEAVKATGNPQPVNMPFTLSVTNVNYTSAQQLIDTLNRSIRPIVIDSMSLSGAADNMSLSISAHTFYQPAKSINITTKVVK